MLTPTTPTPLSLRYREIARQAWSEVILPYIVDRHPGLADVVLAAVGSSVAYGLADEYSDIDIVLILPADEYSARESEWADWAYGSTELAGFRDRVQVEVNVKVSTWQREGVGILFDGIGSWDGFYGHHHWVTSLIPIHDPLQQMRAVHDSAARMPPGVADRAADECMGQLAELRNLLERLRTPPHQHFAGMLAYSIAARALPLLFHRQGVPPPFHKWLWPLAERLGGDTSSIMQQLRAMLEDQVDGNAPFPAGLVSRDVEVTGSRELLLPAGVRLSAQTVERALASVQWHLEERACYQMVRALARGFRESALQYMCATRCLLVKGAILLETGQIACGEQVAPMWDQIRERSLSLEGCIWPQEGRDPFEETLRGITTLRSLFADRQALPQLYLDRPLWSPPSYELACILEEL